MEDPVASSFLGTRGYLAPEMLQRREYNRAVDSWALGVIVFVLLCGCLPFDDDPSMIPTDDAVRSKFTLRFPRWARDLSPSAKDLLAHLLDINPRRRYTASQALNHPWVKGSTAPKDSMLHSPGRIILTPGKSSKKGSSTISAVAANRTHMNKMIADRARANSNPRQVRQLVRKKSI
jgi:serine/threonine protein kinase